MDIVRRLWPTLRKHLIALGRWVISRVRVSGAQRIGYYLIERAQGAQARKLAKAIKNGWDKRADRLRARQQRWMRAGRWLLKKASEINKRVAGALEKLAIGERIPETIRGG
jgi:uncharacterized protein involved in exopolysaccharide biosynthesis